MDTLSFLLNYFSLYPKSLSLEKSGGTQKRYRARIIIRGNLTELQAVQKIYGGILENKGGVSELCKGNILRLTDFGCIKLLKDVNLDNPRIPLINQLLDAKMNSGNIGRGHKVNLTYEEIYQEYLKIK